MRYPRQEPKRPHQVAPPKDPKKAQPKQPPEDPGQKPEQTKTTEAEKTAEKG